MCRRWFSNQVSNKEISLTNQLNRTMASLSTSSTNAPLIAVNAPEMVVNERDSSSEDEETTYSLQEAEEDWYFNKMASTRWAYRQRVNDLKKWYLDKTGRTIDTKLKKKHLRLYFTFKKRSCSQLRAVIVCIKSYTKHLTKRKILKKDVGKDFESTKQLPAKIERNMSAKDVRKFFKEAQKKNDPECIVILQLLAYAGVRRTALSRIACNDIIKSENQNGTTIDTTYSVRLRKTKGNKSRRVKLNDKVGKWLYDYARSLGTVYLFQSKKGNVPKHPGTLSEKIKRIARNVGLPYVSMHHFRHFYCSQSLHSGADLATVQEQMGHSSISTTSVYAHGSTKNISNLIDLSLEGEDITIQHNKSKNSLKI
jgi:site-specific recombinase XerD